MGIMRYGVINDNISDNTNLRDGRLPSYYGSGTRNRKPIEAMGRAERGISEYHLEHDRDPRADRTGGDRNPSESNRSGSPRDSLLFGLYAGEWRGPM